MPHKGVKVIVQNRKARHDYFVVETYEAGIELRGTEVKSIRLGQCNLKDCFAQINRGEISVYGMHISPYEKGNIHNTDPLRSKRLLMHKSEIRKLNQQVMQQGLTLIPLTVYLTNGLMKVELGLCKGKKNYDKREDMLKRDAARDIDRAMKDRGRHGHDD
ncbi:MAG: SsrA-binding protein SmpB [Clostridia bacterium]|nr:SsrA-binding protein SmpB [Clostridia bacterium]